MMTRPVRPEMAMRTRPKAASTRMDSTLVPMPVIPHRITNCSSCTRKAPSRLAVSRRPMAGTTRRSGSTSQSVSAKMNRANGLPERVDIGMRWYCMYRRNRQVPAINPAATSSKSEVIW